MQLLWTSEAFVSPLQFLPFSPISPLLEYSSPDMHFKSSEKRKENPLTDWDLTEPKNLKTLAKRTSKDLTGKPLYTLSSQVLDCSWNSKSADLPDIEACNVVWDFTRKHSTQLVSTCQGVIHAESTQNAPLFVCGDNQSQNNTNTIKVPRNDAKSSICLRRRRLSNASMEHHVRDRLLAEAMSRTSTPIHDCDYWIDHSSDIFNLVEVDLSRNHLTQIPSCIISIAAQVEVLNLSHNRFTHIPEDLRLFKNLRVLDLSHNNISVGFPRELPSALSNLKVLRLYGNQITELPETLGEMSELESLMLGSIFGGNLVQTFPEKCISKLVNLKELDLTQNQLVSLPSDIGHPHSRLERLAISENQLLSLPSSVGRCRLLRSFDLSRNSLLDLPIEITDLIGLETLDLTDNKLCVIPGDIALFMSKTTVLLSGNPFTLGLRRQGSISESGESDNRTNASLTQQLRSSSPALEDTSNHFIQNSPVSPSHSNQEDINNSTISPTHASNPPPSHTPPSKYPPPSLRELAARQVLKHSIPVSRYCLPVTALKYLERGARPCCHCSNPYVREWISCIEIKNYLGHPKVPRSVRFCSAMCMVETKNSNFISDQNHPDKENTIEPYTFSHQKQPVKPFSSLITQRSNQPPIKSKKPSSLWNTKRMTDRPTTTDW
ncbi:hypothetical protein K7432_007829 [Basidiobolus ranarum]|uniref:Uncharacterized protein n=1 Tax=Basidiobolus ranarum TaxID=34480 RepID=A0ABR2VZI5_9FUNG